jgi:inosine-uridine nucleoside N-ribohydrolase
VAAAMARRIILDVDTGVDDAVAIVFAVLDPRIELVAVTWCVRVTSRAGTSRRSRAERLAASCGSAY